MTFRSVSEGFTLQAGSSRERINVLITPHVRIRRYITQKGGLREVFTLLPFGKPPWYNVFAARKGIVHMAGSNRNELILICS